MSHQAALQVLAYKQRLAEAQAQGEAYHPVQAHDQQQQLQFQFQRLQQMGEQQQQFRFLLQKQQREEQEQKQRQSDWHKAQRQERLQSHPAQRVKKPAAAAASGSVAWVTTTGEKVYGTAPHSHAHAQLQPGAARPSAAAVELAAGWVPPAVAARDPSPGREYYYHADTQKTTWAKPAGGGAAAQQLDGSPRRRGRAAGQEEREAAAAGKKGPGSRLAAAGLRADGFKAEVFIENGDICINNDDFCINNDDFCT